MKNVPRVSIITPVYNGASYINQTLNSIVNLQTKVSFECLVIDDGSRDTTLELISNFADRARIYTQENIGEAATVNRGLDLARGEYVLVVNADDPLLGGRLLDLATDLLDRDSSIVAVYPDWKVIDQEGRTRRIISVEEYSKLNLIGRNMCLPGPGAIFRKSAAHQIGGRNLEWKFVSDYDFWLRLSGLGEFQRIPEVLAQWREHSKSTSVAHRTLEMAEERIDVVAEFLKSAEVPPKIARLAISNSHYLAARLSYFDKNIDGRKLLVQGFIKSKTWPSELNVIVLFFILTLPLSRFMLRFVPTGLIRKLISK